MKNHYDNVKEQAKVICEGSYMKVLDIIYPISKIDLDVFNTNIANSHLLFNFSKTDYSRSSAIYPTEILEIATRNIYEFIKKLKLEQKTTCENPMVVDVNQVIIDEKSSE